MLDAKQACTKQAELEAARGPFDTAWQQAAELFLPRQADFPITGGRAQGMDRENHVFDEYAIQAAEDGQSVFEGYVTPRGALWQLIVGPDELMKMQHVRAWYEAKTRKLFSYREDPRSGFVQQLGESAASLLVFGNQSMLTELRFDPVTRRPAGLRYRSQHIGSVWIEQDWQGLPFRFHRKFTWTAEQAAQYWSPDVLERAPKVAADAADDGKRSAKHEFLATYEVNYSVDPQRADWRGKPYIGGYISLSDKAYLQQGGWSSCPITYSRYAQSPTEDYGRGPGTMVLPAVKAAQQIMLDLMVAAEIGLMPPLGAHDDMMDQQILYAAREITYGAIDSRGNPLVQKLFEPSDMQGALLIQQRIEKLIDHAFFRDLLSITKDMKSHVTDGQLYERTQEKGILLSPLSRQETEWFSPMLEREIDLMAQMGDFDDMPHEVREAGGARTVKYDNPLNRARRAEQASGYFRAFNTIGALAQAAPQAMDMFFREYPLEKVIPGIGEIEAIPASWAATDAEKRAADAAKQQQQQQQQLLEALPIVSKAANDMSKATQNVA